MKLLSTIVITITAGFASVACAQDTGAEVAIIVRNELIAEGKISGPQLPSAKPTWVTANPKYSIVNPDEKILKISADIIEMNAGKSTTICSLKNIQLTVNSGEKKFIYCGKYVLGLYLETTWGYTYFYRELALPGADESMSTTRTYVPWDEKLTAENGNDDSWKNNYSEGFINGYKYVQIWDKY